jgi:hypothetical protein
MREAKESKTVLRLTARWALLFGAVVLLAKFIWMLIVPSLFPGAVGRGFVVASLSWLTAIKIGVIVLAIMIIRDVVSKQMKKNQ